MNIPQFLFKPPDYRTLFSDLKLLFVETLRSSACCQHLDVWRDELSARRAKVSLLAALGNFNRYETTDKMYLLNHAIGFMKKALIGLPKPHQDLDNYATLYVALTCLKFEKKSNTNSLNNHISALYQAIAFAGGSPSRFTQLGSAYFNKFRERGDAKALRFSIKFLERCYGLSGPHQIRAATLLSEALWHRASESRQFKDLDRVIDILKTALLSIPKNEPGLGVVKQSGLELLWNSCGFLNASLPTGPRLENMVNNLEAVLSMLQKEDPMYNKLAKIRLLGLLRRFFQPLRRYEMNSVMHGFPFFIRPDTSMVSNITTYDWPHLPTLLYQALPNDRTRIRLLKLLPGEGDDPIKCMLTEVELDDDRPYEAISYVWGDSADRNLVRINNATFLITTNLHLALLRLRDSTRSRTLWVDAVCINQADLVEKQHQIAIMRDIFKKASSVIMWLGEPRQVNPNLDPQVQAIRSRPDLAIFLPLALRQVFERYLEPSQFERLKAHLCGTRQPLPNGFEGFPNYPVLPIEEQIVMETGELALKYMYPWIQGRRAQHLAGPRTENCDWSSVETISGVFSSSHAPDSWPLLGAFSLIFCFTQTETHFNKLPFFDLFDDPTYHISPIWQQSVRTLMDILNSAYWNRAWIIQEVVLAKDPVLYYGQHILPFKNLLRAQEVFHRHYHICCDKWGTSARQRVFTWWSTIHSGFAKFEYLANLRKRHATVQWNGKSHNPRSLFSLLRISQGTRQATDPRDLVYGILGLADDQASLEIDYSLSIAEVFTRAALDIILKEKNLSLLLYNGLGRNEQFQLPSWVPDWSEGGMDLPELCEYRLYAASSSRRFYTESRNGSCLKLRTVQVDRVIETSCIRTLSWVHPRKLVTDLQDWRIFAGLPREISAQQAFSGNEGRFWRTLFADVMIIHKDSQAWPETTRRMRAADLHKIREWWEWLQTEAEVTKFPEWILLRDGHPFEHMTRGFWTSTEMKKLMRTASGRLGLGPSEFGAERKYSNVEPGDEIHVAFGCNMPIILRPVGSREGYPAYEFVGTCYLQGVMDGEAVADEGLEGEHILLI